MRIGSWKIGRPYIHRPFHPSLPTLRDWMMLLFGLLMMAFSFKQYIKLGQRAGWHVAIQALVAEVWRETKEAWHG